MWPARPAGARQHVVHARQQARQRREERVRLQVALHRARRGRCASQPSSSGVRQSTPITSPPASRCSASRCPVPVPKWMSGTPRVAASRRTAPSRAAARTRGSRRRRGRPPRSRRPAAPARPPPPARAGSRPRRSASSAASRCQVAGSSYIIRLVSVKWFEWPPSIAYDASVKGAPAKPMSGTLPSSSRRSRRIASSTSRMRPRAARSAAASSTSARVRTRPRRPPGPRPRRSRTGRPAAPAAAAGR